MEISIATVIVALVIGGIVTRHDLIATSATRAQIAQIEKYNSAVQAFKTKYGGLPGDLTLETATANGFITKGCDGKYGGSRDGNGLIQGGTGGATSVYGQFHNETQLFWQDLGAARMLDNAFPAGGAAARDCTSSDTTQITTASGAYAVANFLPKARAGYSQYVYVYSSSGANYFGVSAVSGTSKTDNNWALMSTPNLPVVVAYNIDKKTDDGMPLTGHILAQYLNANALNASPNAADASATTCYDTTSSNYNAQFNNGLGKNCALSFRIQ